MSTDIIQVRLVSNWWVAILLPVLAITISLATLAWTIWTRRADQARPRTETSIGIPTWTPGPAERLISIDVTNAGRQGALVLRNIHLTEGRRRGPNLYAMPMHGIGPTYPATLSPGETAHLLVNPAAIAEACREHSLEPSKLRVVVATGHGTATRPLSAGPRAIIRELMG